MEEVEVPEEDIQASYDERASRYITPERRSVEQLLASDEEIQRFRTEVKQLLNWNIPISC